MINKVVKLDFKEIPQLSKKDIAYQTQSEEYEGFYEHLPSFDSFKNVIEAKQRKKVNRNILVEVLKDQYKGNDPSVDTLSTIESLLELNTFTITTAHQPVFMLGPLYMIYKIISTVRLSRDLKIAYPEYNFVPIFVSGGEDHDLEEVATLHLFNKDFTWKANQSGAVGRMQNSGLKEIIDEVTSTFGNSDFGTELESIIYDALSSSSNYGQFNTNLYKALFSDLGVIVLNMDDPKLKKEFLPIAVKEINEKISFKTVVATQERLSERGIKEQAHVRDINLFYINPDSRDRIIQSSEKKYSIGDKEYDEATFRSILSDHSENISPNVVMRPIYQEFTLPNLAYIGGGGEIAYWLERKTQFEEFDIPFPMLVRRNSALIVNKGTLKNISKLGFASKDFLHEVHQLEKLFISQQSDEKFDLEKEAIELSDFFSRLAYRAKALDPGLEKYILAEGAKQNKVLKNISSKLIKSAKSKNEVQLKKIEKVKGKLFPNGKLQERYDSFIPFYLKYGKAWFDKLVDLLDPMDKHFLILEE